MTTVGIFLINNRTKRYSLVSFILVTNLKILNKNTRICTLSFKFMLIFLAQSFAKTDIKWRTVVQCRVYSTVHYSCRRIGDRKKRENHATKKQNLTWTATKELFKPSKMLVKIIWQSPLQSEWTDLRQEVSLHGTCEREG